GTGLAGGVTLRVPVHLEVGLVYHGGSMVSAASRSIVYWSRAWSVVGPAAVGYDVALFARRFILRPKVLAGGLLRSESTWLGGVTRRGTEPLFTAGPGVDLLVRFAGLHAGIDARGLVVPSEVAAPMAAVYAVFGF